MVSSRERRVAHELKDIEKDQATTGVSVVAKNDQLNKLLGTFSGPPGTPYGGGTFEVDIELPDNYPFKSPAIRFITRVYHPNVSSQTGAICLDTVSTNWTPVNTIKTVLLSLRLLLESPNPSDPQDAEVASMMINDPEQFKLIAHDWSVKYAGAPRRLPEPDAAYVSADGGANSGYGSRVGSGASRPTIDPARYLGYNRDLVHRFTDMGFSVDAVVKAFLRCRVERYGGQDYMLDDELISDVTVCLFAQASGA